MHVTKWTVCMCGFLPPILCILKIRSSGYEAEAGEGGSGSCSPVIFKAHVSDWCAAVSWRAVLSPGLPSLHGSDVWRWGGGWGIRVARKWLSYSVHVSVGAEIKDRQRLRVSREAGHWVSSRGMSWLLSLCIVAVFTNDPFLRNG